ncbi:hypothetical protein Y1Q_0020143 [Alligator mississippiensis]|uniref:Uncharacterized protein n=1 Tax=Alligator mississippiensis TaxID=8496 RepID=A0A151LZ61_ALLMI|nr:hypothetical protein Y1Q_0020143 [Alligator mississippiensis]
MDRKLFYSFFLFFGSNLTYWCSRTTEELEKQNNNKSYKSRTLHVVKTTLNSNQDDALDSEEENCTQQHEATSDSPVFSSIKVLYTWPFRSSNFHRTALTLILLAY